MRRRRATNPAPISIGDLENAFVESYVRWREELAAASTAWDHWLALGRSEPALRCAAYGAALDREEAAAEELRACVDRIQNGEP